VGRHQGVELADQPGVAAEAQERVDAVLGRREAQLLQAADLVLGEVVEGEVGQRRPSPEPESFFQELDRLGGRPVLQRPPALPGEALEARGVDRDALVPQDVAGGARDQGALRAAAAVPGRDRAAQVGDVPLHGLRRRPGRALAPERVDDPIDRDDLAAVDQQQRE
jgi:hypothetical protein